MLLTSVLKQSCCNNLGVNRMGQPQTSTLSIDSIFLQVQVDSEHHWNLLKLPTFPTWAFFSLKWKAGSDIMCLIIEKLFLTMVFVKSTKPQRVKRTHLGYPIYIVYCSISHYYVIVTFMVLRVRLKIMLLISQAMPKTKSEDGEKVS